ncbi:MAG: DUF2586 domain-containing protein [Bacteroidales bacterium]|jgi:hypothetical protein|nr:DUF2586 domain-containing protein [Bacteroidales bacterium]
MALNDIIFQKTNGGIGRTAAGQDFVSGLIMELEGKLTVTLPSLGFDVTGATDNLYVAKLSYFEQLATQYGISEIADATGLSDDGLTNRNALNAIVYHVSEYFRMNPTGLLYLGIRLNGNVTSDDIKALQHYSGGSIRQMGVFTADDTNISSYQTGALDLEREHEPLSILLACAGYGPYSITVWTLSTLTDITHSLAGRSNVSIVVSCDLAPDVVEKLGGFAYFGCIGNLLGAVSKAAVNESVAWVQKFPLGLKDPGFITGDLLRDVAVAQQNLINDNRYIFVRTHTGTADNFYNDSFTLDVATSDYAYIENVRTIDKATRGIRSNLLPYLNAPLYVDAETGKLRSDMVAFLETTAGVALEQMEAAGELSGYRVEIDPDQNVLATSELEVVIKQVPVGVMRKVLVKIGFTTKL